VKRACIKKAEPNDRAFALLRVYEISALLFFDQLNALEDFPLGLLAKPLEFNQSIF